VIKYYTIILNYAPEDTICISLASRDILKKLKTMSEIEKNKKKSYATLEKQIPFFLLTN
jgi:hypothetical protein